MFILQNADVPAGIVKDARDLVEHDDQLTHRGYFIELKHPTVGTCKHQGWPAKFSLTPAKVRPAPVLGQHNEYICTTMLHLSVDEIAQLTKEGILR